MGEAKRTSEARMRAAAKDVVAALDRHGDKLVRHEAIGVLGFVTGTFASVWGGEAEVVGKAAAVAKAVVMNRRATNGEPWRQIGLLPGARQSIEDRDEHLALLGEIVDAAALEDLRHTLARYGHGIILTDVERTEDAA